jgi:hypothetical protein
MRVKRKLNHLETLIRKGSAGHDAISKFSHGLKKIVAAGSIGVTGATNENTQQGQHFLTHGFAYLHRPVRRGS